MSVLPSLLTLTRLGLLLLLTSSCSFHAAIIMADRIIVELTQLRAKVEKAKDEWSDYIGSLHPEASPDTERLSSNSTATSDSSITTKVKGIDSFAKSLESRLHVLISLKATRVRTLGSATQLISQHLPNQILGSETANSLLMRTLFAVEIFLKEAGQFIASRESIISEHFDGLRRNYDAVVDVVHAMGRFVDLEVMLQNTRSCVEEMLEEGTELADVERLLERLQEGQSQCEEVAGQVKRQVLKYKRNAAVVGIRVARQMLITEFLDS